MRRFFKLLIIYVAAGILLGVFAVLGAKVCFNDSESYVFFVGDTSKNCREVRANGNAALTKLTLSNVCGECAEYPTINLEEFLRSVNGKVIFTEELSDSVNYYCTADLPYSVTLYGKTINLHVCVKQGSVKVGSPIIFGGY